MTQNRTFLIAMSVFASYLLAFELLNFALPLLALEISGTGTGLALIKGVGFIPHILFAVFIGVINARIRKRSGMRAYTGFLAAVTLILWALMATDNISITALAVFMIAFNATGYALANLQQTLIRLLIPHEKLGEAMALSGGIASTISTVAPALAGLALIWIGYTSLTGLIAALLCLSAITSLAVQPTETLPPPQPMRKAIVEGWEAFRTNRDLLMMTIAVILTNGAAGAADVGLLLKLKTTLNLDTFTIGIVLAAAGVGAVIAATIAAPIRRKLGARAAFFWPIVLLAAVYLGMLATSALPLLIGLSFVEGAISSLYVINVWTFRQESVTPAHMGRVAGITAAIFKLGIPPLVLLSGILADTGHLWATFTVAAAINIAAALFLIYFAKWGWLRRKGLPS